MTATIDRTTKLTAIITSKKSDTGRCKNLSHVVIKAGTVIIAQGTLGGTYSAQQALTEYRRFGEKRFQCEEAHKVVKALGL